MALERRGALGAVVREWACARPRREAPRRRAVSALGFTALLGFLALAGVAPAAAVDVKVEIEGVKGAVEDNVRALLSIAQAKDPSHDRVHQLHNQAVGDIERALQPFGYYKPTVDASLKEEGGRFVAHYDIDPGPLLRLAGVDLQLAGGGAGDKGFRKIVQQFPLRRGSPLVHGSYEAGKQSLVDYAAAHGYLEADFTQHEIRVDLAAYTARVRLAFYTGPQYAFGEVTFDEAMLDPDLLYGYLPFKPGEPFDLRKLLQLQDALSSTPYFRRVEVLPKEDEAVDRRVPIHVSLVPARRERLSFGLGYGPDTGARGTLGIDVRRVNRRGHRAEALINASQVEQHFSTTYLVPKSAARTDYTTYSLGYEDVATDTEKHRGGIASAGLDRARGKWRQHFDLAYLLETFTVGPDSANAKLLMPEATVSLLQADDVLYPLHGRKIRLQLRAANEATLSTATFLQGIAEAKYVQRIAGPIRGLARVRLGYTETQNFHELPSSLRFFAGGDQSVRGYGFQELTPRRNGLPTGGDALMEFSVEFDALLLSFRNFGRFGAAVFYDSGNALDRLVVGEGGLKSGAGVGLRWLSPVGLVRADVAFALDEPNTPMRFHFSLGPDL
ncbi:MAG TPA: autotransporter assembly complex family protein [Thermoanaerobaculia bacterium]|jgi:translocation and assembly module TamA|nr:autotransporter assembly complex family protein [Thermoanaerobaculia bacterium]